MNLNASDKVLGGQTKENQCLPVQQPKGRFDINRDHQDEPHDDNSQSTHDASCCLGQVASCPHVNTSLLSRTRITLIQDLVEDVLSSATSRSALQRSGEAQHLWQSTGKPVSRPSTSFAKEDVRDTHVTVATTLNLDATDSTGGSTSETNSSNSDSENDTILLSMPVGEPGGEANRDVLLLTKNEKDASKIHIPRPEFVATKQHTLVKVGTISAVLGDAVVVTTFNLAEAPRQLSDADICNATALDTGSLLCFSDGTVLGAVFDTFGPVASPLYVVRFNSSDEIPTVARVGVEVLYVEQKMRLVRGRDVRGKGYDASGKDDEEVNAAEFSDDEMERRAKKMKRTGVADRRTGPLKRSRGYGEAQPRRERIARQKEDHDGDRERARCHGVRKMSATAPTTGAGHSNLERYDLRSFPSYQRGMSSQPHAFMPPPNIPSGMFNNPAHVAATMPAFSSSGIPLSVPSPTMNPSGVPGSALNAMLPTRYYSGQGPPAIFPEATPPYTASFTVSRQQQFVYPEQSWRTQENYRGFRQNARGTFAYHHCSRKQAQNGHMPNLGNSQMHPCQEQMSGRTGRDSIREVHHNATEASRDGSRDLRPQDTGMWHGVPSEQYRDVRRR